MSAASSFLSDRWYPLTLMSIGSPNGAARSNSTNAPRPMPISASRLAIAPRRLILTTIPFCLGFKFATVVCFFLVNVSDFPFWKPLRHTSTHFWQSCFLLAPHWLLKLSIHCLPPRGQTSTNSMKSTSFSRTTRGMLCSILHAPYSAISLSPPKTSTKKIPQHLMLSNHRLCQFQALGGQRYHVIRRIAYVFLLAQCLQCTGYRRGLDFTRFIL